MDKFSGQATIYIMKQNSTKTGYKQHKYKIYRQTKAKRDLKAMPSQLQEDIRSQERVV